MSDSTEILRVQGLVKSLDQLRQAAGLPAIARLPITCVEDAEAFEYSSTCEAQGIFAKRPDFLEDPAFEQLALLVIRRRKAESELLARQNEDARQKIAEMGKETKRLRAETKRIEQETQLAIAEAERIKVEKPVELPTIDTAEKLQDLAAQVDELHAAAGQPSPSRYHDFLEDEQDIRAAADDLVNEARDIFAGNPELEGNEFFKSLIARVVGKLRAEHEQLRADFKSKYGLDPEDPDFESKLPDAIETEAARRTAEIAAAQGIAPLPIRPTIDPTMKVPPSNGTGSGRARAMEAIRRELDDLNNNRRF